MPSPRIKPAYKSFETPRRASKGSVSRPKPGPGPAYKRPANDKLRKVKAPL